MCWPARCPGQPGTSITRLATRGVSWTSSVTLPSCQFNKRGPRALTALASELVGISVSPVPLLAPWIAIVVVAVRLPEARLVLLHQSDAPDPLGALPEVEVRDEHPCGATVLGVQRLAVELEHDPSFPAGQVLERKVRRVAAVRELNGELRSRFHTLEERVHGHAGPTGVELAPFRHTVNVLRDLLCRKLAELLPGPAPGCVDLTFDNEVPLRRRNPRSRSGGQDRVVGDDVLAGRQPGAAGSVPPLATETTRYETHEPRTPSGELQLCADGDASADALGDRAAAGMERMGGLGGRALVVGA